MTKWFYLLLLFQFFNINGQTFGGDRRYTPTKYRDEVKDNTQFVVLYNITFLNGKDKKGSTQAILQIGNNFSNFLDVTNVKRDSLQKVQSKLKSLGIKEVNELGKFNVIYKKKILKDFLSRTVLVQDKIMSNTYEYQESFPKQSWIITNERSNILGYSCKSAKLNFRGRNYLAWYTEEIPKSDGPANFEGLPGLILKITDENGDYDFSAIAISKTPMDIYVRNEESILKVSRDKFREVQKAYFENPGAFLGKAYNEDGSPITVKLKPIPYNPLELE